MGKELFDHLARQLRLACLPVLATSQFSDFFHMGSVSGQVRSMTQDLPDEVAEDLMCRYVVHHRFVRFDEIVDDRVFVLVEDLEKIENRCRRPKFIGIVSASLQRAAIKDQERGSITILPSVEAFLFLEHSKLELTILLRHARVSEFVLVGPDHRDGNLFYFQGCVHFMKPSLIADTLGFCETHSVCGVVIAIG